MSQLQINFLSISVEMQAFTLKTEKDKETLFSKLFPPDLPKADARQIYPYFSLGFKRTI